MWIELQHKDKPETSVCASILLHEPSKSNNNDGSGLDFISWKTSKRSAKSILWNCEGVLPLGFFVYVCEHVCHILICV